MEEQQRERILDDLRGVVRGELLFDDLSRALYSTDASIFQLKPLGVAVPQDEDDLRALVTYAHEHQVPLVPRGAGTGFAGESLGSGLTVDLSRHFRAIVETGADWVRVQPGVVYRDLNVHLARVGRRFAPDPASGAQCTLGGMLATNASGAHALRYGYTRDHVVSLRVVLDNGEAAAAGKHAHPLAEPAPGRFGVILGQLSDLLTLHADLIRLCRPHTRFNRCGYLLHDVLGPEHLDVARLLVGSEGTLAFFTEATLRTIPLPAERSLVLLGFSSLEAAIRATQRALPSAPCACELIDRRLLTLARGGDVDVAELVPASAEAVLLIEYESSERNGARDPALDLVDKLQRTERPVLLAKLAFGEEEINRLWQLRETALPSLFGLRGGPQPVPFIEDVGVPVDRLGEYLLRVQELLQKHDTTASFLVHAGAGQVHARPFLDLRSPEGVAKLWPIAEAVHGLALELGGTVSTQHGTGLARTPWVDRQYGPLFPVLRQLKAIFDPQHLLNPGKIVGPDPGGKAWPLRVPPRTDVQVTPRFLRWQPEEIRSEIIQCNGCGHCRTEAPGQRMCPVFRATHAEAASPRAKANLLRHLLEEGTDVRSFSSDDVREVADLCVNCKMCAVECPAHVNIPKLMLEAKAANVAEHGMDRTDWFLARSETFAALGSAIAGLANAALQSRTVRWLLEKTFGISRRRRLPVFAARNFLRRAAHHGWTRRPQSSHPRVAYFVDVFANYNDPLVGEATVAVLHHNGVEVYVPPDQIGCGMAPLAYGDVETAREVALHNLRILADLARDGYRIVCSEPTAALMLRHDYLDLTDDPDAKLVSERTVELTSFLWDLHQQGGLRTDLASLDFAVGHHVPCHLKALGQPPAGSSLLALIPGLRVHTIDVSCSGMAGTFGLKARSYDVSLAAGRPMLAEMARPRVLFGATQCSACRMQMEEGTGKRTLHPVQYLALSYGLMPELLGRLQQPIRELVL